MKKYFLAGIMGCALGVLVSVKVAGPVLAQDTESKKQYTNSWIYLEIYLSVSDLSMLRK